MGPLSASFRRRASMRQPLLENRGSGASTPVIAATERSSRCSPTNPAPTLRLAPRPRRPVPSGDGAWCREARLGRTEAAGRRRSRVQPARTPPPVLLQSPAPVEESTQVSCGFSAAAVGRGRDATGRHTARRGCGRARAPVVVRCKFNWLRSHRGVPDDFGGVPHPPHRPRRGWTRGRQSSGRQGDVRGWVIPKAATRIAPRIAPLSTGPPTLGVRFASAAHDRDEPGRGSRARRSRTPHREPPPLARWMTLRLAFLARGRPATSAARSEDRRRGHDADLRHNLNCAFAKQERSGLIGAVAATNPKNAMAAESWRSWAQLCIFTVNPGDCVCAIPPNAARRSLRAPSRTELGAIVRLEA